MKVAVRAWLRRRWPELLLVLGLGASLIPAWRVMGLAHLDAAALQAMCRSLVQ